MTQALINNLNILPEKAVKLAEKMPKTEGLDFGKVFEAKTNSADNETDLNQTSKESNPITVNDNQTTTKISVTDKTSDVNTNTKINNESSDIETDNSILQQAIQNAVQECADEDAVKINAAIKTLKLAEALTEENIISEVAEEELNLIEELIVNEAVDTEETTITEEELPTMYNELNTLEDPTAVILLQSQIQKTVKTPVETGQLNDDQDNNAVLMKTGNKNLNTANSNTTIFKQFDNVGTKDLSLVNITPKENANIKSEPLRASSVISENVVKELNVEVVSSQTAEAESSMGDLMQNQSPQEQAARVMIQGDIKYDAVEAEVVKNAAQPKLSNVTPSKIIEQISKQLEGMFNNSKLNMVLNPGSLGKLNLQLINSKEGLLAQFTVTTQDAKDLLMKGLDGLKESLLAQGVSVDNISIKLEESDSDNKFDWTEQEGSRGGNKQQHAKKQKDNEKNFEQIMFDIENESNL